MDAVGFTGPVGVCFSVIASDFSFVAYYFFCVLLCLVVVVVVFPVFCSLALLPPLFFTFSFSLFLCFCVETWFCVGERGGNWSLFLVVG